MRTVPAVSTLLFIAILSPVFSQPPADLAQDFLLGGEKGLYRMSLRGEKAETGLVWTGGSIRSIVPAGEGWYFVTSKGIVFSPDLRSFENRSAGLPLKTLDIFEDGHFALSKEIVEIKSLAADPAQPGRLAACANNEIWYSETSGKTWISLGSPSAIPGIKAVSFGPWQGVSQHVVWASHSIKGVFAKDVNGKNGWAGVSSGLPKVFGGNGEEVSSFALVPSGTQQGLVSAAAPSWNLIAGLSFLGKVLQWDPARKSFVERWDDGRDFGSAESLAAAGSDAACAIADGSIQRFFLAPGGGKIQLSPDARLNAAAKAAAGALRSRHDDSAACMALIPGPGGAAQSGKPLPIALGELWMLADGKGESSWAQGSPEQTRAERLRLANGRNGLYLQTGFAINASSRASYFALIKSLGLNSLVVDMKDDYGRLRFVPSSPLVSGLSVLGETLDIESFVAEAKKQGIYLIARIVVFKDETLYKWKDGALAVRDAATGAPWRGIKADGQLIQEYWVDPYSTDVWRYNAEIAKEVTSRGFDEAQFDYIRFPTDGENLDSARFPRQEAGMNPDSALESFLRLARQSLAGPISVDIYGANGWYRSGTRTGQDVEMLSKYVDVICPMLYPSHFEQEFLAQAPAELRPYRLYKIGTLRNLAIARGRTLVRPYVQAFYLDVSYDKIHYGKSYVEEEVRGVREGANQGMTFWNNSGRYADLPSLR